MTTAVLNNYLKMNRRETPLRSSPSTGMDSTDSEGFRMWYKRLSMSPGMLRICAVVMTLLAQPLMGVQKLEP